MVPLSHILTLSMVLFILGVTGFIIRRNVITVFMCIELMLNAVNLAFVGFARYLPHPSLDGQLFVFFVIVVAAAEAAVGLAIIVALYRNRGSLSIDDVDSMKM